MLADGYTLIDFCLMHHIKPLNRFNLSNSQTNTSSIATKLDIAVYDIYSMQTFPMFNVETFNFGDNNSIN